MKAICRYCDQDAIGYEKDYGQPDFNVCRDCAHIGTTVYMWNGGTWEKSREWHKENQKKNGQ